MRMLSGSCFCGQVAVSVPDEFGFIGYCHCVECRKWSGSAFAAGGLVDSDAFQITSGEDSVSYYRQSDTTTLAFCKHCGSSLFSKKLKLGKHVIRLGILDDVPTQRPNAHLFTASKAPWHDITDHLAKFDSA